MNKARKTYGKRKGKKTQKKSTVSTAVKNYVKREIHTNIEDKCFQVNPGPLSFGNVLESPDFNAYPCAPLSGYWFIAQGSGQGSRIGNIIKTRKCYLSYVLRPTAYDAGTNPSPQPSEVRLMLGYVKNTPSFAPIAGDINQLFQAGSTSSAPVGTLKDLIATYNTDYWTIKKSWTHKIGYSANTGTGGAGPAQFFQNNDFKLNVVKRLDITKYMPKTCVFNDSSATTNTKNLFFMHYAVATNGGTYSNITLPVNIDYWIDYHSEDA